ncbi:diguanylate cyclase domain-containing protein [Zooshikella sp. RANM57]|uniref:diguanylate cyclase domain-containing protein n=1 Tax=Zooshikella sp. RANM57 TaxID=3425863 RepID=UPI003D6DC867
MISPPFPFDEKDRLATLYALNILDSKAEERIDRYTRFASLIFNVPIALVTLVDEKRQWFKSKVGLSIKETNRIISFCAHCILTDKLLIVPDTHEDKRFYDNPLVTSKPFIRFYAGVPLEMPNGYRIGTLCIIDQTPRSFCQSNTKLLTLLGDIVEKELSSPQFQDTDELTGISNLSGFDKLAFLVTNLEQNSSNIQLILFTLSSLSEINQRYGYNEGDKALVSFSNLLLNCSHNVYAIGRLSGNIFGVLISSLQPNSISRYLYKVSTLTAEFNLKSDYKLSYQIQCVNINRHHELNYSKVLPNKLS